MSSEDADPSGAGWAWKIPLGGLVAANAAAWLWAWMAFADRPALLGSALLAWLFGLRHAADADHLAAIDNVVRKLMQEGQRAGSVGLYFSLGHASVVILACAVVAGTTSSALMEQLHEFGGTIGTVISAGFLLAIAAINLRTLVSLLRHGEGAAAEGFLARILRPAMRLIRRPWQMYPLGFLFGLGFDTATEIGLLALAATQAASGVSFVQVLIFPALFTAGMALVDTADSVLMEGAYRWAFVDPQRKFKYNLAMTGLSVAVAVGVGGIEAIGALSDSFGLSGGVWDMISALPEQFPNLGFGIAALFMAIWAISVCLYYRRKPPACEQPVQSSTL